MKKIEIILAPKKFLDLEQKLRDFGIPGMTVTEVKGYGNQQTRPESYLLLPKTKVELYCPDEIMEELVRFIIEECQTGQLGDGKVAIYELTDLVRIRTGERGVAAV